MKQLKQALLRAKKRTVVVFAGSFAISRRRSCHAPPEPLSR